jgi:site-specific DNA-cytosine methylase
VERVAWTWVFIQAGFEVVGAWDFDKYAVESYTHNIGMHVEQMSVLGYERIRCT